MIMEENASGRINLQN